VAHAVIDEPIGSARDQDRKSESSCSVGDQSVRIVDRVNLFQVGLRSEQESGRVLRRMVRRTGGDDHRDDHLARYMSCDGNAVRTDEPRLGGAAGFETDRDRAAGLGLARESDLSIQRHTTGSICVENRPS
jgi:hypothetical protein